MKNVVIHRSNQHSETAHDHRAGANHQAAAQELQRCAGSQYARGDQARGPDDALAQHTAAELELMQAMEAYKQSSGRLFPTWSEVLEVLRSLGYHKRTPGPPRGTSGALFESHARPADIDSLGINEINIDDAIEGWARALSLRDKETEEHTRRVTEMTLKLAGAIHLDRAALTQIRRGALLHDIGKMGVPDAILHKPGPLSDEEREIMQLHPVYAFEWLSSILVLRPALDIPYCHHERWDGTGYPRGLKGRQIPLAARIFAVVDIWDALRSDRPYRGAWPAEKVGRHLHALAGTHLDPEVVEAFFRMMQGDGMISDSGLDVYGFYGWLPWSSHSKDSDLITHDCEHRSVFST